MGEGGRVCPTTSVAATPAERNPDARRFHRRHAANNPIRVYYIIIMEIRV